MRRLLLPLALSALLVSVACGGDDEPEARPENSADVSTPEETEQPEEQEEGTDGEQAAPSPDAAAYCEATSAFEEADSTLENLPEGTSLEEIDALIREAYQGQEGTLDAVVAAAPEEIRADVQMVADSIKRVLEGGSFQELFADPAIVAASERVDAYDTANCEA